MNALKSCLTIWGIVFSLFSVNAKNKEFALLSPDGKLDAVVNVGQTITFSIRHEKDLLIDTSAISMVVENGKSFGINSSLAGSSVRKVDNAIHPLIYKTKLVKNQFNELTLRFREGFCIIFRAYNDGIAYRFVSSRKGKLVIQNEQCEFHFPQDWNAYVAYVKLEHEMKRFDEQFDNSFENTYQYFPLTKWNKEKLALSPLLVEGPKGKKICILEADLTDYPGMYLYNENQTQSLKGVFAPYPKEIEQGGHNNLQGLVKSRENYIAKYADGENVAFPWRAFVVSEQDAQLASNDMVCKLATPRNPQNDYSWVKPGKVAWDWWNDWSLYDVNFTAGVNNQTYKYYIDFASKHGIQYVILDEGWAVNLQADLMQVVPEIDLKELISYANERHVELILWAGYYAFNKDIEGICKHYSEMGIKGFKVDFMNRDDQLMVNFLTKSAQIAAKYKMLLDFHGVYKPTGLQHTFPNVINFEGVHGLEQMKWAPITVDQVTYDVTFPFIRMVAGPVDYTQGAMRNATKSSYRPVHSEPMSQGTRCHQLAEYVVFESPLNMLCDSPSNYMREEECVNFISGIPTIWDESRPVNGEVSKYLTIARRKGDIWYLGSLTNWDERQLTLDLSFLGEGNFRAEVFRDGANADKSARDYQKDTIAIPQNRLLPVSMAQGGGFVMKIYKN